MEIRTKKFITFFILPLSLLVIVVWIANFESRPDFRMHVHFYGYTTLVRTSSDGNVVIDGGPDDKILTDLGQSLPFFDRQINLVVLTKVDSAHVSGLVDVLKRYQVKNILIPESSSNLSAYWDFLNLVDAKHIKKIFLQTGQRVWLDPATVLDIYSPNPFTGEIIFGKARISFPTEEKTGELVSDGIVVVKN